MYFITYNCNFSLLITINCDLGCARYYKFFPVTVGQALQQPAAAGCLNN